MAWTWVRPADPGLLEGRPLLDIGTGDGQTLRSLVRRPGLVVGADRSLEALEAGGVGSPRVAAEATELPFRDETFEVVLAADLFHHLDPDALKVVLSEILRVLEPGGRLVAWWYESPGRDGPGAPRYARPYEPVAALATGFASADRLELEVTLEPAPATVGLVARA